MLVALKEAARKVNKREQQEEQHSFWVQSGGEQEVKNH